MNLRQLFASLQLEERDEVLVIEDEIKDWPGMPQDLNAPVSDLELTKSESSPCCKTPQIDFEALGTSIKSKLKFLKSKCQEQAFQIHLAGGIALMVQIVVIILIFI